MTNCSEVDIRSTRIALRPFTAQDANEAFSCITPKLTRFMTWNPPASRQDFDDVWQSWLPLIYDGSNVVFVVRDALNAQFLGLAGVHRTKTTMPELGIWIREDRHGHGFGQEAVTAVARWASSWFQPASFLYPVAEENQASRRIAKSLGGRVIERLQQPKYMSVVYEIPSRQGVRAYALDDIGTKGNPPQN